MIRDELDQQIVDYLNRHSTGLKPCNPIEIAESLGLSADNVWDRCRFLMQKKIITEFGWGTSTDTAKYFI
jgi:DNA-binding Lrp family transcriptional regulator